MTEKEVQAHEHVRWRKWLQAVTLYDQILNAPPFLQTVNNNGLKDRQISCLLGRCECFLELGKYDHCVEDARKILIMLNEQQADCLASISRTRRWLVHSLHKLKKYTEAEHILREWIIELSSQPVFCKFCKTLERYKSVIQMLNSNKNAQKLPQPRLEEEMSVLDTKLEHWATNNLPLDKFSKLFSNKGANKRENSTISQNNQSINQPLQSTSGNHLGGNVQKSPIDMLATIKITNNKNGRSDTPSSDKNTSTTCSYCAITFNNRNELRQHCQTEAHQNVIVSDEGRDWKWRPPPRGYTLDSYSLCEAWSESNSCHFGNQCVEAHGQDELNEWKERFEYRRMRVLKACEKELYGKSYTENILERWIQSTAPEKVMCEKIVDVELKCEQDLVTSISSKTSKREWIFVLTSFNKCLKAVALLQDAYRSHFAIKSIKLTDSNEELLLRTNQEWVASKKDINSMETKPVKELEIQEKTSTQSTPSTTIEQIVTIEFQTEIYGTFRQSICFDFGCEPLLVRHICVDVVPVKDAEKLEEIKRDIINSSATRWDSTNTNLVKFETTLGSHLKTEAYLNDIEYEKDMLERYPCPRAQTFTLTQSSMEKHLTQNNYRSRIHELLYVEEIARYEQVARFNLSTKLTVTSNYILTPAGMATSTAKYSLNGELFGLMHLGKDISEDTSAGRLILSNCSSVYISPVEDTNSKDKKRNVYEALIEDKGKNVIYLKLSDKCVEGMKLKDATEIHVDIQFQLNRLPYCEWHHAVDKMTDFKIIFPATDVEPNIPWTPKKQWSEACEPKLNAKQREAINAITTALSIKLPPILLIGPFGTGKTYTLAQAIKQLLGQPEAKILICTHSNSAADLYIKEYLHPWIEEGLKEAVPLRVYYHKRWVATVNSVVQKYCVKDGAGNFRRPSVEDIMKYRIVVVTLNISMELANLDIPKGHFTHIFLDEAAQAMECEAIMPLALANDSTRIVLAGDHMQMSPELFSAFAKERKLHISLLERLYGHYPSNFPCKILLCENYRAHEAIIKFTSELFYEQKLIASGKQPRHEKFYPLTFFTTRGEDIQDKNSTAFYNNAEVYEVVERVLELRKKWPSTWGKINDSSIGIMTPYADQVFRIRSELRKRRMGGISVERVLNVQGKQFRAVFLSTVRTRRTCLPNGVPVSTGAPSQSLNSSDDTEYGFLSNSKLLNTAITRAQSLVAVVGDPVALCSIGRCRKVWERFIEVCHENKSLFGITMWQLRSQLDGVELKRGYVLNPLAPEFIPRSLQPEAYLREQAALYLAMTGINAHHHHSMSNHGGPLHVSQPLGSHPGLLSGAGVPHAPIAPLHHPINMTNQLMPAHIYGPHNAVTAYTTGAIMNPGIQGNKTVHNFTNHPSHVQVRTIGSPLQNTQQQQISHPSGPPLGGQSYNARGPPPMPAIHMNQLSTSPYMNWHGAQPPMRPGPPMAGGPYSTTLSNHQPGIPTPQPNPNATLWGPPPQTNPWSNLPKAQMPQPSNVSTPCNSRTALPPQQVPNQNIRPNNVVLQPPTSLNNSLQTRTNSNDLNYMTNKSLFGNGAILKQHQPTLQQQHQQQHFANFGCNVPSPQHFQMINQRNVPGIANGPISPMDTYLQRPSLNSASSNHSNAGLGVAQSPFFCQNTPVPPPVLKEKDYQLLNNVHLPPLNVGVNMFPVPGSSGGSNIVSNNFPNANNKQQSPTNLRFAQTHEFTSLLPPNMSIYEMAFESKDLQYKWYLKLLESQGQEAASKFTEMLRQVMTVLQQPNTKANQQSVHPFPPQTHLTTASNQIIQRDLVPPIVNYSTQLQQNQPPQTKQQQQQQQQQPPPQQQQQSVQTQQRILPPSLVNANPLQTFNHLMQSAAPIPSTTSPIMIGSDDSASIDVSVKFNQQIDMVFNSIINGNEISQPILRDLFDVNSGINIEHVSNNTTKNNTVADLNGDILVNITLPPQQNVVPTVPQSTNSNNMAKNPITGATLFGIPYIQNQHQSFSAFNSTPGFLNNNTLTDNKEFLLAANMTNTTPMHSVPLYRRQGVPVDNGQNVHNGPTNATDVTSNIGSTMSTQNPNNILSCGTADILTGLGTGTAGNLIEALFQSNVQQDAKTLKHMPSNDAGSNAQITYSNYNNNKTDVDTKQHDIDLFMGNNNTFVTVMPNMNTTFHSQNQSAVYQPSNTYARQIVEPTKIPNIDSRGATYAAVLSQTSQTQNETTPNNIANSCNDTSHNYSGLKVSNNSMTTATNSINNMQHFDKNALSNIRELGHGTNGFYNYFE